MRNKFIGEFFNRLTFPALLISSIIIFQDVLILLYCPLLEYIYFLNFHYMKCTGDSVVLLFSENYEIHVFKTKRSSLLQMVWAVLGLRLKVYLK